MTDRNRSDLDREPRNDSNRNPMERPENRSTKQDEKDSKQEGAGNRSTGNIEGDENLNRR